MNQTQTTEPMTDPRQTLNAFIREHRITMTTDRVDSNPAMDDSANMDHWKCVLRCGSRRMSLVFSMGYGLGGKAPKIADVLDCLASDASSIDGRSFEEWADDIGMNPDSRKGERTYKIIERQSAKLSRLIGEGAYDTLCYCTERL